jgi:hypothetical protein
MMMTCMSLTMMLASRAVNVRAICSANWDGSATDGIARLGRRQDLALLFRAALAWSSAEQARLLALTDHELSHSAILFT